MTNTLHLKKKTLWDLKKIAGLPIYGQVYDEYTPWNEELYGFDEISKEKYHSECARELFAKYQRLALRNQYTKVDHHVWVNHFFKGEIERQAPRAWEKEGSTRMGFSCPFSLLND